MRMPEKSRLPPSVKSSVIPSSFRHITDYQSVLFDGTPDFPFLHPIQGNNRKQQKTTRNPSKRVPGSF